MILKTKWVKLFQRKKWKKTSLRKYKLFFSLLKNIRFVSMLFVCCFNSIVFLLNSKCNVPQHSFLNGRTQRMKVGLKISNKISLTSGVPQGGVLSPLVFVLYVSGLEDWLEWSSAITTNSLKTFMSDSAMLWNQAPINCIKCYFKAFNKLYFTLRTGY